MVWSTFQNSNMREKSFSLIGPEAKKIMRQKNQEAIKMQETAEIVGWIRTSGDRCAAFNG
jgi:hypothetical protein